jgi:hypothetical protein
MATGNKFTIVIDLLKPALLHGDLNIVQLALLEDGVAQRSLRVQAGLVIDKMIKKN